MRHKHSLDAWDEEPSQLQVSYRAGPVVVRYLTVHRHPENFVSFSNEIASRKLEIATIGKFGRKIRVCCTVQSARLHEGREVAGLSNQTINVISLRRCRRKDWPILVRSYPVSLVGNRPKRLISHGPSSPRATKWRKKCHRIAGWRAPAI